MPAHNEPAPPSLITTGVEAREVAPYQSIAAFYDTLMWHVDYIQWADYLIRIAERFVAPQGIWCEGGCGTGNLALRIARFGYRVCGFDLCSEMIEAARRKATIQNSTTTFSVGDFRTFSAQDVAFYFVVYDGLNYLLETSEVEQFLANAADSLQSRGILVFDLCTERNSVKNLNNWFDRHRRENIEYRRHSWYDEDRRLHHNDFEILDHNHPELVHIEHHVQRIYTLDEAQRWISRSNFRLITMLGNTTFLPGHEKNDRVHFVLRKK